MRVRTVTIVNDGSPNKRCMSCSCAQVQAMLLPCVHTAAVLNNAGLQFTPYNIHIRWWSLNALQSYSTHVGMAASEHIKQVTDLVRTTFYVENQYIGFPIDSSQHSTLMSTVINLQSVVFLEMKNILQINLKEGLMVCSGGNVEECLSDGDECEQRSWGGGCLELDEDLQGCTFITHRSAQQKVITDEENKHDNDKNLLHLAMARKLLYPIVDDFIRCGVSLEDVDRVHELFEVEKIKKIAGKNEKKHDTSVFMSQTNKY